MTLLKDFELDLPYTPDKFHIENIMKNNSWDYYKSTQFDYNQNWKNLRNTFSNETRCITSLYSRLLGKYENVDCKKVLIECVNKINNHNILNLLGILTVQVEFDVETFMKLSDSDKKKTTLEVLDKGIKRIIQEKGWIESAFAQAYKGVIDINYMNAWSWKKPIKSPQKDYIAEVFCEHGVHSFDIYIIIKNNHKEKIKSVKVKSEIPHELVYSNHLGQLKWVSDDEVVLINQFNNKQWLVKV